MALLLPDHELTQILIAPEQMNSSITHTQMYLLLHDRADYRNNIALNRAVSACGQTVYFMVMFSCQPGPRDRPQMRAWRPSSACPTSAQPLAAGTPNFAGHHNLFEYNLNGYSEQRLQQLGSDWLL